VVEPRPPEPRFLIVADLHLGLGAQHGWSDGPAEGSAASLGAELRRISERTQARSLVIAGDVKHPIVGTPPGLRRIVFGFFSDLLVDGWRVEVVLGNHDAGLTPHLPKEVVVHPSGGVVRAGFGIFHGHRWPTEAVLAQRHLVAGHLHPGIRLAPSSHEGGSKRRCWVRATFPPRGRAKESQSRRRRFDARDLSVLPPFNPLAGTEALNRSRPSQGRSFLFARFLQHGESRLYLMDGTDLGRLTVSPGRTPPTTRGGARPGR
jgi:metallophosphoesterase superfamily enzyme